MNPRSPSLKVDSYNPLSNNTSSAPPPPIKKIDTLAGTVLITDDEWKAFLSRMKACENNEERLAILEKEKAPYLFTSAHLMTLIDITLSVKTRIGFIEKVGPRLTNPRARANEFIGMFRFSEEKQKVEEVLKARTQVLASSLFRSTATGFPGAVEQQSQSQSQQQLQTNGKPAAAPFLGLKGLAGARQKNDQLATKQTPVVPQPAATTSTSSSTMAKPRSEVALLQAGGTSHHQMYQAALASPSNPNLTQLAAAKQTSSGIQKLLNDDHMSFVAANREKSTSGSVLPSTSVGSPAAVHVPSSSASHPATTHSLRPPDVPEEANLSFSSTGSRNNKFSPKYCPPELGGRILPTSGTTHGTNAGLSLHPPSQHDTLTEERPVSPIQSVGSLSRTSSIGSSTVVNDLFDSNHNNDNNNNIREHDSHLGDNDTVLSWRQSRHKPSVRDLAVGFDRSKTNTTASVCSTPRASPQHTLFGGKELRETADLPPPAADQRTSSKLSPGTTATRSSVSAAVTGADKGYWTSIREVVRPISNIVAAVAGRMGADLGYYRDLPPEGPIATDNHGLCYFRYTELVRKNLVKDYDGIIHTTELERHCDDSEFAEMFGLPKDEFTKLPAWKKQQLKKDLLLF